MEKTKNVRCIKCDSTNTFVIFEHGYNCLRGHCRTCGEAGQRSKGIFRAEKFAIRTL